MKPMEEIEKLKALLETGAISEEEYKFLLKQLESAENEFSNNPAQPTSIENEKNKLIFNDAHSAASEANFKGGVFFELKDLNTKIRKAGSNIKKSVFYTILVSVFYLIGMFVLLKGYYSAILGIFSGRPYKEDFENTIIFSTILFSISGFCWIMQLVKLNKAGDLMENLDDLVLKAKGIQFLPDFEETEIKGLKIGQEYGGGVISFFDRSKMFAAIIAKSELEGKYKYDEAKAACRNYSGGGYSDWNLPSTIELKLAFKNLRKNPLFHLKQFDYWCQGFNLVDLDNINIYVKPRKRSKALVRPMRIIAI